jgi:DNA-binding response OmpR family regulator
MTEAEYEVEVIRDGHQAMKRLREENPSTVVLDLHIPFMNGEEILNYIRMDQRLAQTKVIITTADDRRGEELRDLADLVLIKPIGFRQLRDMAVRMHPQND